MYEGLKPRTPARPRLSSGAFSFFGVRSSPGASARDLAGSRSNRVDFPRISPMKIGIVSPFAHTVLKHANISGDARDFVVNLPRFEALQPAVAARSVGPAGGSCVEITARALEPRLAGWIRSIKSKVRTKKYPFTLAPTNRAPLFRAAGLFFWRNYGRGCAPRSRPTPAHGSSTSNLKPTANLEIQDAVVCVLKQMHCKLINFSYLVIYHQDFNTILNCEFDRSGHQIPANLRRASRSGRFRSPSRLERRCRGLAGALRRGVFSTSPSTYSLILTSYFLY